MLRRALATWCLLLVAAVANGFFREAVLVPRLGAAPAHVASTLLLCLAILVIARFALPWIAPTPAPARRLLTIGAVWLALTLAFEFGFGRWRGGSWSELLADYDALNGRIWVLVLLTTFLGPWLVARRRGGRRASTRRAAGSPPTRP